MARINQLLAVGLRYCPKPTTIARGKTHQLRAFSQTTTLCVSSPAQSVAVRAVQARPSSHQIKTPRYQTTAQFHHRQRGALRLLPLPPSRQFSATSRVSCSAIIPSSIMADRDILPGTVKPSHYDLSISSLNFEDWSYQGHVLLVSRLH